MRLALVLVVVGCAGSSVAEPDEPVVAVEQLSNSLVVEVPSELPSVELVVTLEGSPLFDGVVEVVDGAAVVEAPFNPCPVFGTTADLEVVVDDSAFVDELEVVGVVGDDGATLVLGLPVALCSAGPYFVVTPDGEWLLTTDGSGLEVRDADADQGVASSGSRLEVALPPAEYLVTAFGATWAALLVR